MCDSTSNMKEVIKNGFCVYGEPAQERPKVGFIRNNSHYTNKKGIAPIYELTGNYKSQFIDTECLKTLTSDSGSLSKVKPILLSDLNIPTVNSKDITSFSEPRHRKTHFK